MPLPTNSPVNEGYIYESTTSSDSACRCHSDLSDRRHPGGVHDGHPEMTTMTDRDEHLHELIRQCATATQLGRLNGVEQLAVLGWLLDNGHLSRTGQQIEALRSRCATRDTT